MDEVGLGKVFFVDSDNTGLVRPKIQFGGVKHMMLEYKELGWVRPNDPTFAQHTISFLKVLE